MSETEVLGMLNEIKGNMQHKNALIEQLKQQNEELRTKVQELSSTACTESIENALTELQSLAENAN